MMLPFTFTLLPSLGIRPENPDFGNNQPSTRPITRLAVLLATAVLAGCGGGGGGGGGTSNNAPVAIADNFTVDQGSTTTLNLAANDSDADDGLDLTSIAVSTPANGTLVVNAGGSTVDYTHDGSGTVDDSFTYTINDQSGATSNTVTVNLAVNRLPVAIADNFTVDQGSTTTLNLAANDSDADDGLDLTSIAVSTPANGTLVLNAGGTVDYTHDGSGTVDDSFTYTINDQSGATSNTVTVDLVVNRLPVAIGICHTTPQANPLSDSLSATDPDTSDSLTYGLGVDGLDGAGPILTAKGASVTLNTSTGGFTYTPATGAGNKRGRDSFDYRVTDLNGAFSSAKETVIVDQKIMPLGDSITIGWITGLADALRIGYRRELHNLLTTGGYNFDFVGSITTDGTDPSIAPFIDIQHEGHSGWEAYEIVTGRSGGYPIDGVRAWLDDYPADIILLHIGTNELLATSATDIENILDEIDTWENSAAGNPVTVLLALIIDQDSKDNTDVVNFNDAVNMMAQARTTDDIIIVDQHSAVDYLMDMSDPLHPNAGGYVKMADPWYTALDTDTVLNKCP